MRKEVEKMNLKNRFIIKASIGFALGILVDLIIHTVFVLSGSSYLLAGTLSQEEVLGFFRELFLSGILGLIGNGSTVIYEIESWSILRVTATHFVIAFAAFFSIGLINGWLTPGITAENIIITGIVLISYVMIWLVQYLIYKKEVSDINDGLKNLRKDEKEVA